MKYFFLSAIMLFTAFGAFAQQEDYPGQSAIGYGYDIFDKYANQKSVKEQIFDFSQAGQKKYGYELPYLISLNKIGNKDYYVTEGSSFKKYSSSLAASAGVSYDGLVFGGSLEARFGNNSSKLTSNYFYTIADRTEEWNVYIPKARLKEAKKFLTTDAKDAINNWSANELFDAYGTHVVVLGVFGGCMDMNLTKSFSSREEGMSVGATVTASYGAVNGDAEVDYAESSVNQDFKKDITIFARGGSPNFINKTVMNDNSQYNLWAETIEKKSVLIAFEKGSLIPIWDLADNAERKNILKAAFNKKLALNKLPEGNGLDLMMKDATFFVKSKTSNLYWDLKGFNYKAKTRGGKISLYKKDENELGINPNKDSRFSLQGADRFFKVIESGTAGYVYLQPQHSTKVVTMHDSQSGYHVQLWTYKPNKAATMFKMIEVRGEDNTYYLQSKQGGFYLAMQGNKVVQLKANAKSRTEDMKWVFEYANPKEMAPPNLGKYKLKNIAGGKYLDLKGSGLKAEKHNNAVVSVSDLDFDPDRTIDLLAVKSLPTNFIMQPLNGTRVLTTHQNPNKSGIHVFLYDNKNDGSQQFQFEYAGSPHKYYIKNVKSSLYLQLDDSKVSVNGTPIIQKKKKGRSAIWKLEETGQYWANPPKAQAFVIKSAYSNKVMDIAGAKNIDNAKLFTYDNKFAINQKFKFVPAGKKNSWVYIQSENGGRVLQTANNQQTNNTNIVIFQFNKGKGQKFAIKPTGNFTCVILSNGWKAVTIHQDAINESGKGILLWDQHNFASQQFQLIYADGPKKGQPYQFYK